MGRTKDIIVLPERAQRVPRGHRERAPDAGLRDSVVVETRPGRIEAVVLAPGSHNLPQGADIPAPGRRGRGSGRRALGPDETRRLVGEAVKRANATLAAHQRVEGWRIWPDSDFPRTHTLKVKRDEVRRWAVVDAPLPVQEERTPVAV